MPAGSEEIHAGLRLLAGQLRARGQQLSPGNQRLLDELDSGRLSPEVAELLDTITAVAEVRADTSGQSVATVAGGDDDANDTPLLTTAQVAEVLGVSERTVRRRTAPRGPLPAVRIGRSVRYRRHDLEALIATSRSRRPAPDERTPKR